MDFNNRKNIVVEFFAHRHLGSVLVICSCVIEAQL